MLFRKSRWYCWVQYFHFFRIWLIIYNLNLFFLFVLLTSFDDSFLKNKWTLLNEAALLDHITIRCRIIFYDVSICINFSIFNKLIFSILIFISFLAFNINILKIVGVLHIFNCFFSWCHHLWIMMDQILVILSDFKAWIYFFQTLISLKALLNF